MKLDIIAAFVCSALNVESSYTYYPASIATGEFCSSLPNAVSERDNDSSLISRPVSNQNFGFTFNVSSLFDEFDANSARLLACLFGEEDVDAFFAALADKFSVQDIKDKSAPGVNVKALITSFKKAYPDYKDVPSNAMSFAQILKDSSYCRRKLLCTLSNISSR
jgi:hypothetical protein